MIATFVSYTLAKLLILAVVTAPIFLWFAWDSLKRKFRRRQPWEDV